MRALAYGVISAILAALAMWAGGAFLRADFVDELERAEQAEARQVAELAGLTLSQREALDRSMLELLCRREINVERLSHELDAGADGAAAARMAELVVESLGGGHAAVLEGSAARTSTLARSPGFALVVFKRQP